MGGIGGLGQPSVQEGGAGITQVLDLFEFNLDHYPANDELFGGESMLGNGWGGMGGTRTLEGGQGR